MFTVDMRDAEKLAKDLGTVRSKALPFASREYVNSAAFAARGAYVSQARSSMTLRTAWTERSIQVEKTRTLQVSQQAAHIGSVTDYMATQEGGKVVGKKGKHGSPIPGAAPGKRKGRKGRVAAKNRLGSIQVIPRISSGIRQRKNAVSIAMAAKRGGGVVFLDLRRTKGLFRVTGTKRGTRLKKLWDLSKPRVVVPRNPMLERAVKSVEPMLPALAVKALTFQLQRHKVLGY